jgi:hypothetical protein
MGHAFVCPLHNQTKGPNHMAKYYTLFIFDKEAGAWADEFGDYSRANVEEESDCTYWDLPKIFKKIIAWDDEKQNAGEFIYNKNRELNGETIEQPTEVYVLIDDGYYVCAAPRWNRETFEGVTVSEFASKALTFTSKEQAGEWLQRVRAKQRDIWHIPAFARAHATVRKIDIKQLQGA